VRRFLFSGLIFGVIYFIAISFSELFAYAAFWHLVPFKTFLFFYFILCGVYLGIRVKNRAHDSTNHVSRLSKHLLFCAIAISIGSLFHESSIIVGRAEIWPLGPAALPGISDIYPEDGWVDICWQDLRRLRNFDDRNMLIE
jgi:hypothetical protein